MKIRIVPSYWLENNGRRLDCGPYVSGGIEARELLQKHHTEPLEEVTSAILHAGREGRVYVGSKEYGIPFMGSTDILAADLSYLPLLSKKQVEGHPIFVIRKGWTLITRSGTTGRLSYARPDMDGLACSEHVMRVVPEQGKILPGYLYAYLSTRFGLPLVITGTYGSIIQSIEPHHIVDLPVPRLGAVEERAHMLVEQAAQLLTQHQNNVRAATQLFFESVGLQDITTAEWHGWGSDLGFTTMVRGSESLRALNFNPRFKKLCEKMKQVPWRPLGSICVPGTLQRGGRYKRIDADPEYSYLMIGQKQVFWLRPEGRWIAKTCVDDDVLVEPGTTLIAGAGTLADSELYCRCEFIWGEASKRAYSELFYRVISEESIMPKGALFAFLRSETAFRMLRCISFGSKLQYPRSEMLAGLPVPFPPRDVLDGVNELIISGYDQREKAILLEDQAKSLVEQAIEEGGR